MKGNARVWELEYERAKHNLSVASQDRDKAKVRYWSSRVDHYYGLICQTSARPREEGKNGQN